MEDRGENKGTVSSRNMKATVLLLACLPYILTSCSAYKKVSIINFKDCAVSFDKREDLQYILRIKKLHYSDTDVEYKIYDFGPDKSTILDSHSFQIEDNIYIPRGASGVCVNSNDNNFIIDFGDGILVPFTVYDANNRAKSTIEVNGRAYSLEDNNRKACLYFNSDK